jgi:hypothetical protein
MVGSRRVLALFSMSESNSDARQAEAIDALVAPRTRSAALSANRQPVGDPIRYCEARTLTGG